MNKTCARCEKTVYPTEELKCLDKTWHKGCFKCQECGMTLNMRTYKGYGKLPYCEAHVPKAKPTTMAETPELKRIAENTKLQSNVNYHADFERSKGKFTQVADDPETLRIKANTRIISNVAYHGDLEKKAHMERQRQAYDNGELLDTPADSFHQQLDSYASEMLSPHQQQQQAPHLPPKNHYAAPAQPYNNNRHKEHYKQEQYYKQEQQQQTQQQQYYRQPQQKYDDYYQQQSQQYHKYEEYPNQNANQYRYGAAGPAGAPVPSGVPMVPTGPPVVPLGAPTGAQHKIGRIQDYDPLSDGPRPAPHTQRPAATLIYNSTSDHRAGSQQQQQQQQQQSRPIGRAPEPEPPAHAAHSAVPPPPANHHNQRVYIAMYDYEANDSDEVSFREGDLISNVTSIDEGWMTGQVLRTGRTGMLPANYVELAH